MAQREFEVGRSGGKDGTRDLPYCEWHGPPCHFSSPRRETWVLSLAQGNGVPSAPQCTHWETAAHRGERVSRALTGDSFECDGLLCARHRWALNHASLRLGCSAAETQRLWCPAQSQSPKRESQHRTGLCPAGSLVLPTRVCCLSGQGSDCSWACHLP